MPWWIPKDSYAILLAICRVHLIILLGLAPCICANIDIDPHAHFIMIFHSIWTLPFIPHHLRGSSFRPGPPGKTQDRGDQDDGGERNHHTSECVLSDPPHLQVLKGDPCNKNYLKKTLELKPFKPMVHSYRNRDRITACGYCAVVPTQIRAPVCGSTN